MDFVDLGVKSCEVARHVAERYHIVMKLKLRRSNHDPLVGIGTAGESSPDQVESSFRRSAEGKR